MTPDSCSPLGAPGPPPGSAPVCRGRAPGPALPGPASFHLSPTNSEWPGAWAGSLRPASASEADSITDGGYTHSAQPGPGRGPSCQVSSGTGILVSRKPSPGRGVRGPPSRTSSGFLCTVSTGGRRGENRGQEQTLMWTVRTGSDTRHTGLEDQVTRRLGHTPGRGDRAVPWEGSSHTHSRPRPTLRRPPSRTPISGLGTGGPAQRPWSAQLRLRGQLGRSLGPGHGAETLSSSLTLGSVGPVRPHPDRCPGSQMLSAGCPSPHSRPTPAWSTQERHPPTHLPSPSTRPPAGFSPSSVEQPSPSG